MSGDPQRGPRPTRPCADRRTPVTGSCDPWSHYRVDRWWSEDTRHQLAPAGTSYPRPVELSVSSWRVPLNHPFFFGIFHELHWITLQLLGYPDGYGKPPIPCDSVRGFSDLLRQGFAKETIWKEFRPGSAQPGCGVSCMSSTSGKANKSWSYLALGIGITRITCISVSDLGLFGINHLLFVVSNMTFIFHFIYGMSSFPLTFIFFKMVKTTNQISFLGATRFRPIPNVWDVFYKNIPSERSGAGNKCQSIFRFMFGYLTLHQLIILAHTHSFSTHCTQYVIIV